MTAEDGFDLVMPFVAVVSKGGPFDDVAYAAGWEMGALDNALRQPPIDPLTIRAENTGQADLIAMRHGYHAEFSEPSDGWVIAEFSLVDHDGVLDPGGV